MDSIRLYKPPNQKIPSFIQCLSSTLDFYLKNCDNVTLIRDFNLFIDDHHPESFLQTYGSRYSNMDLVKFVEDSL